MSIASNLTSFRSSKTCRFNRSSLSHNIIIIIFAFLVQVVFDFYYFSSLRLTSFLYSISFARSIVDFTYFMSTISSSNFDSHQTINQQLRKMFQFQCRSLCQIHILQRSRSFVFLISFSLIQQISQIIFHNYRSRSFEFSFIISFFWNVTLFHLNFKHFVRIHLIVISCESWVIDVITSIIFTRCNSNRSCRFAIKSISKLFHRFNRNSFAALSTHRSELNCWKKIVDNFCVNFACDDWAIFSISSRMNFRRRCNSTCQQSQHKTLFDLNFFFEKTYAIQVAFFEEKIIVYVSFNFYTC